MRFITNVIIRPAHNDLFWLTQRKYLVHYLIQINEKKEHILRYSDIKRNSRVT